LTAILAEWTPGQARADAALSGTGMARLDDLADVLSVPVASRRLLGSRIAALGRKVALRFLGPQLTRQTHHNTAVNEILAGLHDRLEIQRQELADLRRLLLREQARREGKRPAA
jgi:hypothetical protein